MQAEALWLDARARIVFDLLLAGAPPLFGPSQQAGQALRSAAFIGLQWPAVAALLLAATPDELGEVRRCAWQRLHVRTCAPMPSCACKSALRPLRHNQGK